ncbi:maleylacetoacetate isomerase [Rhodocista pekingensis]|uniref:Maleylacetoacetate isomerase n=1 Tax=Rhodocista pekingensis TaxID=201185 RepID=A0ABW2KYA9_9PROT
MKLYTYFRSSAAYRVRIALNLKGIAWEAACIHLVKDGGQHRSPDYLALNPQGLLPALEDGGQLLTQSLAILEYLEETHPEPPLLPAAALDRARVRAVALAIACDIHPINNLRVLTYLRRTLGQPDDKVNAWIRHWIESALAALETMVAPMAGRCCFGDAPTLADVCLVPQLFNARRFDCDLDACPTLLRIDAHCRDLPAFRDAAPENQPDAV